MGKCVNHKNVTIIKYYNLMVLVRIVRHILDHSKMVNYVTHKNVNQTRDYYWRAHAKNVSNTQLLLLMAKHVSRKLVLSDKFC